MSWKTPKLDCGSCGPALASHVCSTACVATPPSHKRHRCACSIAWFVVASGISPGYTPTLCNGSRLLWGNPAPEASVGGRAFLAAIPSGRTRMEPAAFISELRARLQIPDADTDAWCPLCDGVLDIHNYHAGMCVWPGRAHSTPLCCPRHCLCLGTPGWPQAGTGTAGPFASAKP